MPSDKIEGHYDMKGAAALSGLTPGVIRMWEARYGWPRPRRRANGYRSYSALEVELLGRVAAAVKAGTPVGQLIIDGSPVLPSGRPARPRPAFALMRAVPAPVTRDGAELRRELEALVAAGDAGGMRRIIAAALRVPPADRMAAVYAPVVAALSEMPASPALGAVQDDVSRALGPGVLEAVIASVGGQRRDHQETAP